MTNTLASAFLLALALTYVLSPLFAPPRSKIAGDAKAPPPGTESKAERLAMIEQATRDAELDRQTGKLSEEDYQQILASLERQRSDLEKKK